MVLFAIGFTMLVFSKNIMKKILGLNIVDTGVYLFLASMGYIEGKLTPIVPTTGPVDALDYINPIPQGLVLTGIVVSVSFSALTQQAGGRFFICSFLYCIFRYLYL